MVATRRCQVYVAKGCCTAGAMCPARTGGAGASDLSFSGYKVRGFLPFYLNKNFKGKNNPCGNFSLTHKDRTFYQQENSHGEEKTCPFLLSSECFHPLLDAEPRFLCSRRPERREGNICISARSVTGTSIIAGTMGSAQARLARAASLQRSLPDLFLSGLGAGC